MSVPVVLVLGTCDTKLSELVYVRDHIAQHGADVKLMDVGRDPVFHLYIDYPQSIVLSTLANKPELGELERSEVIKVMCTAASKLASDLYSQGVIHGAICIGGSGGTSLGASVMRTAFPIGFPKIIVSTVASGNVGNFVGETDITMMPSIVDIAGQNSILNPILENAAVMIVGAARAYHERTQQGRLESTGTDRKRRRIAVTMFGVTTRAADSARVELERQNCEVFVFHATGVGGRAMEKLIASGRVDGVLDLTTTEMADELVGGIMKGGPDRLTAASKMGIPQIVSMGALDMVNFGPRSSVPAKFNDRVLYEHNPDITLMRTSVSECCTLGEQVAEKLRTHAIKPDMVKVFIPAGGVSEISRNGGRFCDEAADKALFEAVKEGLADSGIAVVEDMRDINDNGFAMDMARSLMELLEKASESQEVRRGR